MKFYHLIFLVLLFVAVGIASALFPRSEPPILSESTDRIPGMTVYYPADMALLPDVSSASEAGFDAVAMRNFTPKVPFQFPAIDYLNGSEMYIQISELDKREWEKMKTGERPYPEAVFFVSKSDLRGDPIEKGGVLSPERVEEKKVEVAGLPAIERQLQYRGARGTVEVVFTYFESGGKPFQATLLSGSSKGEKVYEEMLRRIELKR